MSKTLVAEIVGAESCREKEKRREKRAYTHAVKRKRTERRLHSKVRPSAVRHLRGTARGSGSSDLGWRPLRRSRRAAALPLSLLPAMGPGHERSSPRRRESPYAPQTWHHVTVPDTNSRCARCAGPAAGTALRSTGALHAARHAATLAAWSPAAPSELLGITATSSEPVATGPDAANATLQT